MICLARVHGCDSSSAKRACQNLMDAGKWNKVPSKWVFVHLQSTVITPGSVLLFNKHWHQIFVRKFATSAGWFLWRPNGNVDLRIHWTLDKNQLDWQSWLGSEAKEHRQSQSLWLVTTVVRMGCHSLSNDRMEFLTDIDAVPSINCTRT